MCPRSLTIIWQLLPLMANIKGWRWLKFGLWDWRSLLLQSGCRRSPTSIAQREVHGHQTWYRLGELLHWSTSGKYRWPLVMGTVGTWSEPLRPVFNSKKWHNPYSPSSPMDCKHTGTPPTLVIMLGLATETLRWSHNNLPSHSLPLYSLQSTREIHILALLTGR